MKKLIAKTALLLATTLALPTSANAVVVWDWSWSGNDSGLGTLTTNDLSGSSYLITAMTGTWNGANVTLLPAGTLVDGFPSDNLLLNRTRQLTDKGLAFSTVAGDVNLWYSVFGFIASFSYADVEDFGTFTATIAPIAPIPEPETYALMLAGLAVVGAAAKRRRKTT